MSYLWKKITVKDLKELMYVVDLFFVGTPQGQSLKEYPEVIEGRQKLIATGSIENEFLEMIVILCMEKMREVQ